MALNLPYPGMPGRQDRRQHFRPTGYYGPAAGIMKTNYAGMKNNNLNKMLPKCNCKIAV